MEGLLGDSLPKHFGSGWWSGVFGLLLGLGSFLAVLVFRYPQWLTASETAPRYPVETMRAILALAIVAGFLLSALNILLRPSKRLGSPASSSARRRSLPAEAPSKSAAARPRSASGSTGSS